MTAYAQTTVSISKSQEQIRTLLMKNGVRGVQFAEDFHERDINVRFAKDVGGNMRTVSVSMHIPEPKQKRSRRSYIRHQRGNLRSVGMSTQEKRQEQMARTTYRALHYWLKAQFEAIEFGLVKFEDVFLSHFEWMIDGRMDTIGNLIQPYLERPALQAPPIKEIIDGVVETP